GVRRVRRRRRPPGRPGPRLATRGSLREGPAQRREGGGQDQGARPRRRSRAQTHLPLRALGEGRSMTATAIRVDVLPASALPFPGRVGMTLAPGRKARGASATWDRDLDEDLRVLRDDYGAKALVTLMRDYELADLGIPQLFERVAAFGLASLRLAITDGG